MLKSGLLTGVKSELGGEDRFLEPGLEDMLGKRKLNPVHTYQSITSHVQQIQC